MKTSLRTPIRYEQERIEALKRLGCVACAVLGVPNVNQLELHHILSGGARLGHWFTIFLCRGHHQGDWSELQLECIDPEKRVAISDGRKRFNAAYGTERSLWERCQERLKLSLAWPESKILPRRTGGNLVMMLCVVLTIGVPRVCTAPMPAALCYTALERWVEQSLAWHIRQPALTVRTLAGCVPV